MSREPVVTNFPRFDNTGEVLQETGAGRCRKVFEADKEQIFERSSVFVQIFDSLVERKVNFESDLSSDRVEDQLYKFK